MENSRHPAAKFRRKCLRLSTKNSFRCSLAASLRKLIFLHFPPSRCFVSLSRVSFSALASICSDRLTRWKLYCIFMCFSRICSIFKAISHCPDRAVGLLSMVHGDASIHIDGLLAGKFCETQKKLAIQISSHSFARENVNRKVAVLTGQRELVAQKNVKQEDFPEKEKFSLKTSWKLNNKVA